MPQSGFTPIITYNTATASAAPSAGNLTQGELAVNVTDKKLYTKNSGGSVVQVGSGPDATETLTNKTLTSPDINGGTIDGTAIGGTTPAAGNFTTLSATNGASPDTAPSLVVQGAASNQGGVQFGSSSVGYRIVGGLAYAGVDIVAGGVTAGHFSSSGLAVTGTLSVTKSGAGYQPAMLSFATPMETGSVYRIGMASGGSLTIGRSDTATTNVTLDSSGNLTLASGSLTIGSFTVATRPAHAAGKMIYVSDGGAGAVFQGSNGSSWVNLG